jgi:hypothetical protein
MSAVVSEKNTKIHKLFFSCVIKILKLKEHRLKEDLG